MSVTDTLVRILAEALVIGNGILDAWVDLPANAAGPLDPSATVSGSGNDLVGYLASSAVIASGMVCTVMNVLF